MQSEGRVQGSLKLILPCGRRLLVSPHETPDYKGRILLPDSVKTTIPTTGIIRALGYDLEDGDPFKEGDAIVFSKFGGVELKFDDGKRIVIVHEDDVLGILTSKEMLMDQEAVAS